MSESKARALEELGRRVAGAIASGEFELARALTDEPIRVRAGAPAPYAGTDPDRTTE